MISTDPEEDIGALAVESVGDDCVVWASDYPHPDAHFPGAVAKSLETLGKLSAASRAKVFATNAAKLYGIDLARVKKAA
jgi:predicted TIM-barrel fold metal-dependent hydrolase